MKIQSHRLLEAGLRLRPTPVQVIESAILTETGLTHLTKTSAVEVTRLAPLLDAGLKLPSLRKSSEVSFKEGTQLML